MFDEKIDLDVEFAKLGAKKVGHPVPVRTDNKNPFEHLGGKCVLKPSDHPLFNAKPEESVEKEDDIRE